jgi:hypothetical protein
MDFNSLNSLLVCGLNGLNLQCHKITVFPDNSKILMTMEITEVVIPDPEVVLERAHSSKFSGKVL